MFRNTLGIALFLLLSLVAGVYLLHVPYDALDILQYQRLVVESSEVKSKKALEKHPAMQTREGVQKEIYVVQGDERLHLRIQSKASHLAILQKGGKFEAVEKLDGIECWIQEKIDRERDCQEIRKLVAKNGIYTFPLHQFSAETVSLAFYPLPGLDIPTSFIEETPYRMQASAIELDLLNEHLFCEEASGLLEKGDIHFSSEKLIWNKKEGHLILENQVALQKGEGISLFSDHARLLTENDLTFEMQGKVRLISPDFQNQMSFAVADSLFYSGIRDEAILTATYPHRVLFWQEGLSISAPEVLIGLKEPETVQGRGDVHFSLDVDEENTLQQIFSNYL